MQFTTLLKAISTHLNLDKIQESTSLNQSLKLSQYVGSSQSFVIHELSKKKNILVITPDYETAQFIEGDLQELGNKNSFLFSPTFKHPYDEAQLSDSTNLVTRSETLQAFNKTKTGVLVTSAEAIFDFTPSPKNFQDASIEIKKGDLIEPEALSEKLLDLGYEQVSFVGTSGEYSLRGGIVDIFPLNTEYPVRIEFFGDEIDSIREFDIDSQRSVSFQEIVRLVPNVSQLRNSKLSPLFDFVSDQTLPVLVNHDYVLATLKEHFEKAISVYESKKSKELKKPDELFCNQDLLEQWLTKKLPIYFGRTKQGVETEFILNAKHQPDFNASIKLLRQHLQDLSKQGIETTILCDNEAQQQRFEDLLGESTKNLNYHTIVKTLHKGFVLPTPGLAIYTDHQIFNRYHRPKNKIKKRKTGGLTLKEIQDLKVGDFVVHIDYGVGKFAGFRRIKVNKVMQESVMLHYANDSVLYVNVTSLHKLQKYSGKDGAIPKITKLGSNEWAKKKSKTKSRLKDIAKDLIELYAKRKSQKAYAFKSDNNWQIELEASFMYEETEDQMKAILDVKNDMELPTPMDRLVCGDVGFGKTEVAVRAAFKAVMDGKQVAVLVPTTILADQHFKTFSKRMEHFPVKVEALNRFKTKAEQKDIIKRTKAGDVDILIGTHRITSKDVEFKDLGLMVIDEEQRFGVSVKEKLKQFRATVDVLTLSATPIPRTLHMSLMGARDLSTITTPPPNRQPVLTEIHSFNEQTIRDAIMQEISRGGQVFFIHNRVQNIGEYAEMIRRIAPNVRVRFAHGQMTGTELEHIIHDFYNHKFDVLVSTNIVENGIDISNANTIIINRADRFGLSELHQLRGRVGRSNRKAFCYLITPPLSDLSLDSRKRLMALEEYSDLGSGFNIAMRDLDIRGAGDVLGAEQSGFINELGYDLYIKILNDAIKELKQSEMADQFEHIVLNEERPDTAVEIDEAAQIPMIYVQDNVERLNLYRKLARSESLDEINEWTEEITDRFGKQPQDVERLIEVAKIKLLASNRYFEKVTIRGGRMWLQCVKPKSELGKVFYEEGLFQDLVQDLQKIAADKMNMIQKNDTVRFVITSIETYSDATNFLEQIYIPIEEGTFAQR